MSVGKISERFECFNRNIFQSPNCPRRRRETVSLPLRVMKTCLVIFSKNFGTRETNDVMYKLTKKCNKQMKYSAAGAVSCEELNVLMECVGS